MTTTTTGIRLRRRPDTGTAVTTTEGLRLRHHPNITSTTTITITIRRPRLSVRRGLLPSSIIIRAPRPSITHREGSSTTGDSIIVRTWDSPARSRRHARTTTTTGNTSPARREIAWGGPPEAPGSVPAINGKWDVHPVMACHKEERPAKAGLFHFVPCSLTAAGRRWADCPVRLFRRLYRGDCHAAQRPGCPFFRHPGHFHAA